jgi:uncharacterized Zn finger protein
MREDRDAKAERLLISGAVTLVQIHAAGVLALVEGDTALHRVEYRSGRWSCDCIAATFGVCSHATAVSRVTAAPGDWSPAPGVLASIGGGRR